MKRSCIWNGVLVGLREWLPSLTSRFSWTPRMGCNNVRCGSCGHAVRHAAGLSAKGDVDFSLFAETEDWASLPFVRSGSGRLYACQCSFSSIDQPTPATPSEHSWEYGHERMGWHCGGHDVPDIPIAIDGVMVEEGWDVDGLVRKVLAGENPATIEESAKREMSFDRVMWLVDLYHVLPDDWSAQIAEVVERLLASDDLAIRAGALAFFRSLPDTDRRGAQHEKLFRGFEDPLDQYGDLADLWDRIAAR